MFSAENKKNVVPELEAMFVSFGTKKLHHFKRNLENLFLSILPAFPTALLNKISAVGM